MQLPGVTCHLFRIQTKLQTPRPAFVVVQILFHPACRAVKTVRLLYLPSAPACYSCGWHPFVASLNVSKYKSLIASSDLGCLVLGGNPAGLDNVCRHSQNCFSVYPAFLLINAKSLLILHRFVRHERSKYPSWTSSVRSGKYPGNLQLFPQIFTWCYLLALNYCWTIFKADQKMLLRGFIDLCT